MSLLTPWEDTPLHWYSNTRRRARPFHQLSSLWDEAMNEVACLQNDLERQLDRQVGLRDFDRDFTWPRGAIEHHVAGEEGKDGKYTMSVPLGPNIGPEDLKVSLKNNVMTIEAKKEQKSPDGNSRIYQEYHRKFTLPEGVKNEEVKSVLHPNGFLQIEAPLPQQAIENQEPKPIPIEMSKK